MTGCELGSAAVELVQEGCRLVALLPRSKTPRFIDWPNRPLATRDQTAAHWERYSRDNIGVLGGEGLAIVDVDLQKPDCGLEDLEQGHGPMPTTRTVQTGGGGLHYWYSTGGDDLASWNPAPGVEVRARGRQTVAPPSIHPTGARYGWISAAPLAPLPAWLVKPVAPARPPRDPLPGLVDVVLELDPPFYARTLIGADVPDRGGKIHCPLHHDPDPSFHVYEHAEQGWYCFGCGEGGTIVTLAARLAGIQGPVRGRDFLAILNYLRGRLR